MNRFKTSLGSLRTISYALYLTLTLVFLHWQQSAAQAVVSAGPRGGLSLATFAGKDASNASIKLGANAGLFVNTRFSEDLGLAVELNFAQRGAKNRINQQRSLKSNFNYLELPVLGKYYFGSSTRTSPFIMTGPTIAYLLSASQKEERNQDVTKQYNQTDFGWVAGAGIEMRLNNVRWIIDARYNASLMEIASGANPPAIRNSVFTISTGFGFLLGKRR